MVKVTPPPEGIDSLADSSGGSHSDFGQALLVVADKPAAAPLSHDFDLVNDLFGGDEAPPIASPSVASPPVPIPPVASPPVANSPLAKGKPDPVAPPIAAPAAAATAPSKPPAAKAEPSAEKKPPEAKPAEAKSSEAKPAEANREKNPEKGSAEGPRPQKAGTSGTKLPSLTSATVEVPAADLYPPMLASDAPKAVASKPSPPATPEAPRASASSEPASRTAAHAPSKPANSVAAAKPAEKGGDKPKSTSSTAAAPAAEPKPAALPAPAPAAEAAASPAFALPPLWREAAWYLGAGVLGILLAWGAMVLVLQLFAGSNESPVVKVDLPSGENPPPAELPEKKEPEKKGPEKKEPEKQPEKKVPEKSDTPPVDPLAKPIDPMPATPVDPVKPVDPPVDPVKPVDPPGEGPRPMPEVPVIPAPPDRPKPPRIDVNARLAEKIVEIETPPTPLDDFLDFLGLFTTIPISVDPEGLRLAGVSAETPVAAKGAGADIRTLLDEALRPLGLGLRVSEGHVIVTHRNLTREGAVPVPYPLGDLAGDDAAQLAALRELVFDFPLAAYGDSATREKLVRLEKSTLTVEAPMPEQFAVLLFLERLRAARAKPPVNPFVVRTPALIRLDQPAPPTSDKLDAAIRVNFPKAIPFAQALVQLKKAGKMRMILDWRELEETAHLGPSTEVPLVADNLPLRAALDNFFRPLGLEYRQIDANTLAITTSAGMQRWLDEPIIEFHKTGDLVAADRPASNLLDRVTSSLDELGLKSGEASLLHYDPASGSILARLPRRLQKPLADELQTWRGGK